MIDAFAKKFNLPGPMLHASGSKLIDRVQVKHNFAHVQVKNICGKMWCAHRRDYTSMLQLHGRVACIEGII